jgi:hypothetical protein
MKLPALTRPVGAALAGAIAIALTVAAVAFWSASGSGSAVATLGNPQALTLSVGTPSTQASPGASAAVAAVASNPNSYPVQVSSISLDTSLGNGGFGVDGGHSGCSLATLGFTSQNNGGSGWTVPANAGSFSIAMPGALTMGAAAADACQGATFTVHLTAAI